jgi:hypothetical protein
LRSHLGYELAHPPKWNALDIGLQVNLEETRFPEMHGFLLQQEMGFKVG